MSTIRVSAVLITDTAGRALMVRKHGTEAFMQPGGKPEVGEHAAVTAARELAEELGIIVAPEDLRPLGVFHTSAANEPGFALIADAFAMTLDGEAPEPNAEIAEARWVSPDDAAGLVLAPLSRDHLLPIAWG